MKNKIILFAAIAIIFAACKPKTEDIHDHSSDGGAKIQFTAYSNEFELFAEADPFVVGEKSNVLAHFSNLPSFTALEKGRVTLRIIINGKEAAQTLDKPTRKGIYSFDIEPGVSGKGSLAFDIKTEQGVYKLSVPNITVYSNSKSADKAAHAAEISSKTNTLVFTKEQSWKIDFATELPKREAFGQIIKTTAQVQSSQGDEILVSAKTNGIVMSSSDNVLEGKAVSSGQVLFSISGNSLANNNSAVRYQEAQSNFEKAKSDYERLTELAKDKIVSEKELLNAKKEFDNAKLVYDKLSANFSASGQSVASPMSGFVKQLFVKNGQYVESGQPIMSISQNKTLLLIADVQQKYASILGTINSANIRTVHDNETYTLEQLNGKILSFGKNTNNDNYLIPVSLEIDNKGSFVSGGFVELYLKTLSNMQALTIPNSALMEEQGNYFVFVQITPELFEKREIKLGATDGLKTEILHGVAKNERIVTRGAILLKLSQASGALDAHSGHVH